MAPGTYHVAAGGCAGASSTGDLVITRDISVHGAAGQPRPLITAGAPNPPITGESCVLVNLQGHVSHLSIQSTDSTAGVALQTAAGDNNDMILSSSSTAETVQLFNDVALRNSVVVHEGGVGAILGRSTGETLDNVTVSGSVVASANPSFCPMGVDVTLSATNTIATGGFSARSVGAGNQCRSQIILSHSDGASTADPGSTIVDSGGNITASPLFVDAANGNYHQAVGSPTIDAGTSDAASGAFDVDGGARTFGVATDIGADEFGAAAATVRTGGASVVGKSNAGVTGSVNPNGVDSGAYFEYGRTPAYGKRTPTVAVGSDFADHGVNAAVTGLRPSTTYHYRIVGTNGGSIGADRTFVTRADNFKGASLAKKTAKVAKGKARVSLACPARTFTETGRFVIATPDPAEIAPPVTSFTANFTIDYPVGQVSGTKTLAAQQNGEEHAICNDSIQNAEVTPSYTATVKGPFGTCADHGIGDAAVFNSNVNPDTASPAMKESFFSDVTGALSCTVPLPTSTDRCKQGGYQQFGVFKNEGDCVSFVATHGKNTPSGP